MVDENRDGRGDEVFTIARGLNMPNGVAFRDGALYVAEVNRVLRFDGIDDRLSNPPKPAVVSDDFPKDRHHGWKFIAFGPDGLLYVPVGAPCNICETEKPIYASILRMKPDGSGPEIFARGIRNTVGFDWHPQTSELWFTDNGRDMLGDERAAGRAEPRAARRASTSAIPTATATASRTRSSARSGAARTPCPRRSSWARTWPRSACASTPGRCSRRSTAARSSSPSTARGTAASPSATA